VSELNGRGRRLLTAVDPRILLDRLSNVGCDRYDEFSARGAISRRGIRMRMFAKRAGFVVIGMTLALLGPPVAHADDASLVRSARDLGFGISAENLISMGQSACYFLYEGQHLGSDPNRDNPPDRVVERIMRYGNVEQDAARQFLVLSVNEYCPQYADEVGA
jgi:hypothetical protein